MQSSEILITVIVFAMAGFILWIVGAQARAKIQYRAEVQKELIAKFSSASELTQFLNSDAGRLLIQGPKESEARPASQSVPKTAKQYFGEGLAWGVLALSVGSAIVIVHGLSLGGAVMMALGIGFLVNALLCYLLNRKWGTWEAPPGSIAPRSNAS